jgi:polysaccharide pyruvyl transferase WcaK-like protein
VGLPCHIQGFDRFLAQQAVDYSENFFKLGLFCSRTNLLPATEKLLKKNKIAIHDITGINYRGSGHPGFFHITYKTGEQKKIYHLDKSYWGLLFKNYFVQYRCWLCPDKTAFFADISFGDDWTRPLAEDKVGTSTMIIRSKKGKKTIRDMVDQEKIAIEEVKPDRLVSSQALPYKMNILKRKKIAVFFKKAVPHYQGFDFKKEKASFIVELGMFSRIMAQRWKLINAWIAADFFLDQKLKKIKRIFNIFVIINRSKALVKRSIKFFIKIVKRVKHPTKKGSVGKGTAKSSGYHIVTIGGYGYNDVGDEAMPNAIINNLKERFNHNVRFTMLSPYPEFTMEYHKNPSVKDIAFRSGDRDIGGLNFERDRYIGWARMFAKNRIKAFFSTALSGHFTFYKLLRLIEDSDALLNVGGGNINSIMRYELYKRTTMHLAAKLLGKKIYVSGQTIGPFYNDNDRYIAMESLNCVDILTFRDKERSRELVVSLGVRQPMMYDAGDDAFSLKSTDRERAMDLIKNDSHASWFDLNCEQTWALNLKASLNVFKGAGRSSDLSREVNLLADISQYILKHYDSRILLVSTDYCEGVDDRVVLKEVYDNIPDHLKPRVNLLNKVYTDHELKGILSVCDYALGARYHFSVFSLARLVPTIGIASGEYQRKKLSGILGLLDLIEYYIPVDMEYASINDIGKVIDKLVADKKAVREKLKQNVPKLMKQSTKIVDCIYDDLASGPAARRPNVRKD